MRGNCRVALLFLQRSIQRVQRVQQPIEDATPRAFAPDGVVQLPAHVIAPVLCYAPRLFTEITTIKGGLVRFVVVCHGILPKRLILFIPASAKIQNPPRECFLTRVAYHPSFLRRP